MNINLLSVWSVTDVYAHVTQDDWGLGMPEGLAHYDGRTWQWVARFGGGNDFVVDMHRRGASVILFTAGGRLHSYEPGRGLRENWDTRVANYLDGLSDLWDVTILAARVLGAGRMVMVGTRGTSFSYTGEWTKVDINVSDRLYCVTGELPTVHIAGEGVALSFDGNQCHSLVRSPDTCFMSSDTIDDDQWVAGTIRGGEGHLVFMGRDNHPIRGMEIGPPIESVLAQAEDTVYLKVTGHGIRRWDGRRLTTCIPDEMCPHRLYRFGEFAITAGGTGGPDCLFVIEDDVWREIPINLDTSYLQHT